MRSLRKNWTKGYLTSRFFKAADLIMKRAASLGSAPSLNANEDVSLLMFLGEGRGDGGRVGGREGGGERERVRE